MTAHRRHAAALIPPVPRLTRRSLAADVAELLRAHLQEQRWRTRLPGERALAQALHVSRGTLRAALATLEREGTLRAAPGSGRDIVLSHRTRARQRSRSVGLLLPGALQEMRPTLVLWVEALRSELFDVGTRLVVYEGKRLYSGHVGSSLARFVSANPSDCWILALSTPSIQRWFAEHRHPCLVAGSCHPGVDLPSIDLDHAGIGRHAAGIFLAHGHRRVALLNARPRTAGDLMLANAFIHAFATSVHAEADAREIIHEPDVPQFARALSRVVRSTLRPTGLLISSSYYMVAAQSWLSWSGIRVPEKMSLLCRDDDAFLRFLLPEPARYVTSAKAFASRIARQLNQLFETGRLAEQHVSVLPEFSRGATLREC